MYSTTKISGDLWNADEIWQDAIDGSFELLSNPNSSPEELYQAATAFGYGDQPLGAE